MKFNATKTEIEAMSKCVTRAQGMGMMRDRMSGMMDLEATHSNGCKLDFDKLLAFDDFSFSHDIGGIQRHINRETGELGGCFVPRCAK